MQLFEKTIGKAQVLIMEIDSASTRNYKDDDKYESKTRAKTVSVDVTKELTTDDLALLKKYGLRVYTPKVTPDHPEATEFIPLKFSGLVNVFELDNMTRDRVAFDDTTPNFAIKKATLGITRTVPKTGNPFTRISSMKYNKSNVELFILDVFGDADQFSQVEQLQQTPEASEMQFLTGGQSVSNTI